MTQQQEANFHPCHTSQKKTPLCYATRQRAEFISIMSIMVAMHFICFCFLSLQPKGFRRYYSSPLLIHEQFGCIKEVMPIGRFWLLFHSVSLWQCSATAAADFQHGICPQQPSSSFQWLDVLLPSQERTSSKIQSWKRRGCVYCAFHSKHPTHNLLAIILFIIIATWSQGRNLEEWWQ